ncbi:MAG TPA: pitrilysin family protein [Chitinophagaceae bacterium]
MVNRKKAPHIYDPVEFDLALPPCDKFKLDNGVEVYAVNAGEEEVMLVEWVFFAGNSYEDQNIVAATTNFLLKNGTRQKTAYAISEHFEFYGAYLNRHCYNETATLSLHCLTKHLPELLPVAAEILTESVFPEEELAIYKQNQKQRLEVNLRKCDFVANRLIDEYLFGFHHPYGRYTSTVDYNQLQRESLQAFFDKYYHKGRCIMFVAGKLPADIHEQLNQIFGRLPFNQQTIPETAIEPSPAAEKRFDILNDPNGVQAAIRIARPFPNRHHPDFQKVAVLNNIFGGFFGSRLMSNIREDKGYTYGIHSYLQNHIQTSAWMVSTEAGRDVCRATIDEVYKEMRILRETPVDEEELALVRNFMIGTILGDLDGPFQIIARWKNYVLNNLPESYFYNSINVIKTVSAEELQQAANKYLNPDEFYELVVI